MHVLLLLKTANGGLWTVPHIEELRGRGHRVTVLLPPGPGRLREALDELGVPTVESAFSFSFRPAPRTLLGLWRLRRQIGAVAPDVLHYHLYASALAARLCSIGLRLPRVHMVAGPLYLESPVIRTAERALARLDHVTVAGSEHTAERYRTLGLPATRTPVIPYGVDVSRFTPPDAARRARARAALGLDPGAFVAIMVAYTYAPKRSVHRGRGIKGHDVLLEAWQAFAARHPYARLLLVGGGFDAAGENHRRELIARFRLADDPTVVWRSSVPDVRLMYDAADVSVSPSLSENHGAAVEAGAMGVPCIVSDAGALPETVDAQCGWVVPRGDAGVLLTALEEAHLAFLSGGLPARGARARERMVERFDRCAAAARLADLIERVAR
ncbi:glycosyltransferase [Pseudosporangium ferrugineum]|uniref:Glycosyltransferase involved in cell wall biosynthesis n=1 Tax=Pseudosporangium ferrugineum TaxID=439699 RepID=A0A2T0S3E9_9ACTN|nr:glycosyltransferase [Pseudosporangium ferrugineum]PRY27922.1 glycosyltransferase involved in cell wall biosynthesis [Pseudosporangium ferrugineum]